MGTLFARLLFLLAVLVAPISMTAHATAMAAPQAFTSAADTNKSERHVATERASDHQTGISPGHCARATDDARDNGIGGSTECMLACLALPAAGNHPDELLRAPAPFQPLPLSSIRSGLGPEAETPPPRSS